MTLGRSDTTMADGNGQTKSSAISKRMDDLSATGGSGRRGKDQKSIARRIDVYYWGKAHWLRSFRKISVLVCVVLAAGWMVWAYATNNQRIYNPGHVTSAHAIIEHDCAKCHQ